MAVFHWSTRYHVVWTKRDWRALFVVNEMAKWWTWACYGKKLSQASDICKRGGEEMLDEA
jgi:hypothetical protein